MKELLNVLKTKTLIRDFSQEKVSFSHVSLTQEALLIASSFTYKPQLMVIVKSNLYQAQQLTDKLEFWLHDKVVLYANEESLRVEAIAASPEIHALRLDTMARLLNQEVLVCVTHVGALIRYLPEVQQFKQQIIQLKLHQLIQPKDLFLKLKRIGYTEVVKIDQPLQIAQRGGIIDIYPVNYEDPIRIEFFDTDIESLRFFDLSTQRSKGTCEELTILPASELLFSDEDIETIRALTNQKLNTLKDNEHYSDLEENIHYDLDLMLHHLNETHLYRYRHLLDTNHTILNYMDNPLVILSSYEDVYEHNKTLNEETLDYLVEIYQNNKALPYFEVFSDLTKSLTPYRRNDLHRFESRQSFQLPFREMDVPALSLAQHINQIKTDLDTHIQIICLKEPEIKQVIPMLVDQHIPYTLRMSELKAGRIIILNTHLDEGFILLNQNILVYSSKELFKQKIHVGRYYSKFKEAETLHSYQDLHAGDYVVHHQHGVGKYIGIITKELEGLHKDYLHIVYKNDNVLYVPLEQFQLVRKFVSKEGIVPKLHSLGSLEWTKTKARIKENVKDIAERLIALYALRENEIAHAFGEDTDLQREFEAEFEYPLTHDQAVAISEVKLDMMSKKPMDRLLCGDVGFGKTEVAIRAAFKAVSEMKQVAYLCPTTVLANQHYHTFMERFKNYPVNIALLNRFVPENHQKNIIASLKDHKVDILIGTHRILSKDIRFKDLGLLIIDEEQRFGVEHKEKIKEVKQAVHVLSLSATPIPRTLQMSLIGIRALSQLESPPLNRLPILTYVVEKNKHLIKEVIQRELARKGQVFYLYNQVENIHSVAMDIQNQIPEANVAVAHGQMHRDEIEDVMERFTNNEANVLVCTTIVETGIDIPNANTMIIDRADTFGLSQLYQIKGRVGRSDRLAYAYLMYNPKKQLSELAMKRLQSIKEFTELGSGYKIAMRDLTIRGAGEMLGDMQSGFIDTVGIDMYIELLNQAITEKKTGIIIEDKEPEIKRSLSIDGYIPDNFETRDFEKISLYQTIDEAKTQTRLNQLKEETIDLYGQLPKSVELLFEKKRWEILLKSPVLDHYKESKEDIHIYYTKDWSSTIDGVAFFEMVNKASRDASIKYKAGQIIVIVPKIKDWLSLASSILENSLKIKRRA